MTNVPRNRLYLFSLLPGAILFWTALHMMPYPDESRTMTFRAVEGIEATNYGDDAASDEGQSVKLLFGGDMMFDRWIRTTMRRHGDAWPIEPLRETFTAAETVIVNLEGPITDNASVSESSEMGARDNYVFTFDPAVAGLLKEFNITPNLGNNHIFNWKEDGVVRTGAYLREAGVGYFGTPLAGEERLLVSDFSGFRVAFVNYNEFVRDGETHTLDDLRRAEKSSDFVVLYAHWGDEYEPATDRQASLAREFIDAGADIVVGSHSHIVAKSETYRGKTVYYSLGNLVFDQYFRDDTRRGLLIEVSIEPKTGSYAVKEIPVIMGTNGQTGLYERSPRSMTDEDVIGL